MADEGAWDELEGGHDDDDWDGDFSDDAPDDAKAGSASDALLREYKAKAGKSQLLYDAMQSDEPISRAQRVRRFAALLARDWRDGDASPYRIVWDDAVFQDEDEDDAFAALKPPQQANAAAFRIVMNAFMDARDAHKAAGEKWWFEPMHPDFEGLITDTVAHAGDLERRLQEEAAAEARKLKLANKHKKDKERKRAQRATEAVGSSSETDDVNLGALASGGTSCAASSGGENFKSSPSNPPTTPVLVKQPLPAATLPTGQ